MVMQAHTDTPVEPLRSQSHIARIRLSGGTTYFSQVFLILASDIALAKGGKLAAFGHVFFAHGGSIIIGTRRDILSLLFSY